MLTRGTVILSNKIPANNVPLEATPIDKPELPIYKE